jgi:hypothetical protein
VTLQGARHDAGDSGVGPTGRRRTAEGTLVVMSKGEELDLPKGLRCDLDALGPVRLGGRVHAGVNYDVYQIEAGGRALCLKVPAERSGPQAFGARRMVGSVSTVWSLICEGGTVRPADVDAWRDAGRDGSRPYASAEELLVAEGERLRATAGRWNHESLGLWRGDVGERRRALGLVTAWLPGAPLAQLSRASRRYLLPHMMPALWDALAVAPHGDLHGGNIMVSPDLGRFALIDPGAMVVHDLGEDGAASSVVCLTFVTDAEAYPILPPYYVATRRLSEGGVLRDFWHDFVQSMTLSDHAPPFRHGRHTVGHQVGTSGGRFLKAEAPPAGEPHAADLLAAGVMYYRALTDAHPFAYRGMRTPAWLGVKSYDDQVTGSLSAGVLVERGPVPPSAIDPSVTPAEDALALALLDLRVTGRDELVALSSRAVSGP